MVNANLTDAQINAIEKSLNLYRDEWIALDQFIDGRILAALMRYGVIIQDDDTSAYGLTPYGIQSYCATILTKYDGPTHDRIHSALNNYQRLFN